MSYPIEISEKLKPLIEAMHKGLYYNSSDEELMKVQTLCLERLYAFNATKPNEPKLREQRLRELLAEMGENCYVEPPLHANWGCHTHFGNNVYANFNLTLTDDTHIYIDDNVMIAPNVVLATAAHPLDPEGRKLFLQKNAPIHICKNVWIGAGVIVLPGVTIGENTTVGAGSLVTKDIPPNVLAYGSPCRVIRPLTEADKAWRENTYGI